MKLHIEIEQEDDGRWIAEVPELSGVLAYGTTREEAAARVEALAMRVMAERVVQDKESVDQAVAGFDIEVNDMLAKRRWMIDKVGHRAAERK